MKKLIFTLIMALVVGAGVKVEGADRACPTGADLNLFIMSATTAYTYNAVTYSTANGNAVQDNDVVIVSGACNWSALINGLPISVTVKANPSLSTRPVITYSLSGTASYFIKPAPAAGKTIVITFDGVDIVGTSPTPKSATGLINSVPTATGSNTKIVINNCVLRQFATGAFMSTYTANTAGGAPFGDIIITNSRITGFGYITTGSSANTSPANIVITNSYFGTYASATLSFMKTSGSTVQVDHCTFNNVGSTSRILFNNTVSGSNTINNSVFQSCAQTTNNTLTPTATGSGNINLSSSAFAMNGIPGTIATSPALTNAALPAVASLSTTDSWYYASSGTAGYYNSATFTKSVSTLSGFAYNEGSGPSTASTFNITGIVDLFNNLTVTAPANYEVSSDGTTYASSLTFSPTLGVVTNKTVYVRLIAGLTAASYTGDITMASANVTNQTLALTGTVSAGGSPAFTASTGSLSGFNYIYAQGPSAQQSFTVSGSNLTANVSIAAPTNYEVSTTSGSGFGASTSIPFGSGTLSAVPVYVRLKAGLSSGYYNSENIALTSTGATEQGVSCSGTVTPPTLTITPTTLSGFWAVAGGSASSEQSFTVAGADLAGNITLTAPSSFEISTGTGGSFVATSPITLTKNGSNAVNTTTIYVRLKGVAANPSISETVSVSTSGGSGSLTCTGSTGAPVIRLGTSAGGDQKLSYAAVTVASGAGASAISSGYVSGSFLTSDITASVPNGWEVSTDGTNFFTTVTFSPTNGSISGNVIVHFRIKAGNNTDSYNGNLSLAATGATPRAAGLTGSVTGGTQLTLGSLSGISSDLNYTYNGQSTGRSFTITSASLSTDVTVTPPTNFEISTISGSGFTSSPIVIAQATAAAGAQTIYVRTKAGLVVGTYTESIVASTAGANNKSVSVSGTVSAATPTVTVTPIDTYTYNNTPQGPTVATNTGTGSSYTFSYAGTGNTTYGPSATLPTNAGTYTATATVAANGNFAQASSAATAFSILSTGAVSAANTNISSLTLSPSSVLTVSGTGSLVLDANTNVSSITVAAGGQLSIPSSSTTVSGTITLESSASGTATLVDNYDVPTRIATVKQHVTSGRNWYMSAPVSAADYSWLSRGTSVQEWNETTKAWVMTSGTLVPGKGYIQVATSTPAVTGTTGTVDVNGTLNSGDVAVEVTRTESGLSRGFNLVGNPYPSYLDWSKVIIDGGNSNVGTSFWYRTKNVSDSYIFVTHNGTSGQVVGGTSANTDITKFIPPMQAFWVRVNANTNPLDVNYPDNIASLNFKNTMREHGAGDNNKFKAPRADERQRIRLLLVKGTNADEALIYFDAKAVNTFDNYDSPKMMNNSSVLPDLYSKAGSEKLAINGLTEVTNNMVLPLGYNAGAEGSLTLKVNEMSNFDSNTHVYLVDGSIETELTQGTEYTFNTAKISGNESRFSILFRAPSATTGINNAEKLNAQVYVNAANQLVISASEKSNYAIYNTVGMLVENGKLTSNYQTSNYAAGVYVVKVNNETRRVIIK